MGAVGDRVVCPVIAVVAVKAQVVIVVYLPFGRLPPAHPRNQRVNGITAEGGMAQINGTGPPAGAVHLPHRVKTGRVAPRLSEGCIQITDPVVDNTHHRRIGRGVQRHAQAIRTPVWRSPVRGKADHGPDPQRLKQRVLLMTVHRRHRAHERGNHLVHIRRDIGADQIHDHAAQKISPLRCAGVGIIVQNPHHAVKVGAERMVCRGRIVTHGGCPHPVHPPHVRHRRISQTHQDRDRNFPPVVSSLTGQSLRHLIVGCSVSL